MKIGIVGGGQLGRMMAEANLRNNLGFNLVVLDPTENCPAAQIEGVSQIVGDFKDEEKIRQLAKDIDVLTFEIELANSEILKEIEKSGIIVAPSPGTLYTIQDKLRQKTFLQQHGLPVGAFIPINSKQELIQGLSNFGFPAVLKATQDSYDGRGNYLLKKQEDIDDALSKFEGRTLMLEKFVNFNKEVSVIAARDSKGEIAIYPVVENHHVNDQLNRTIAPARINEELKQKAEEIAYKTMGVLGGAGVFGIEMFVKPNGEILINEIAPRVHNSGHHTIEGNDTSQFEQHLRAITGRPLGSTKQKQPVIMYNILGGNEFKGTFTIQGADNIPSNVGLHMYGKTSKPNRKLGHVTVPTTDIEYGERIRDSIKLIPSENDKLGDDKIINNKLIEVRVGSNSDLPKIKQIFSLFDGLNIAYSPRILSAHRTPLRMVKEAQDLEKNGFRVSISAAGGSAHLAGMTASESCVPVVALPVKSSLGGEDALLSMAQMPPGIPNGTVGMGDAHNAGILALRIASLDNLPVREKLSKLLNTNIKSQLDNVPRINIISSLPQEEINQYIDFAQTFGIQCDINADNTSPVVVYIDEVFKTLSSINNNSEQVSIIAPLEKEFNLSSLPSLIKGPYAWVGVNRVKNSIIYAAQILGIYFPEVREKFKAYRTNLFNEVVKKDTDLQEKGVNIFLD